MGTLKPIRRPSIIWYIDPYVMGFCKIDLYFMGFWEVLKVKWKRRSWISFNFQTVFCRNSFLICFLYRVVIGYDEGTIMVKLGREVPVASMDNSGKIIWAKHNEIQTVNIKSVGADYEVWTDYFNSVVEVLLS